MASKVYYCVNCKNWYSGESSSPHCPACGRPLDEVNVNYVSYSRLNDAEKARFKRQYLQDHPELQLLEPNQKLAVEKQTNDIILWITVLLSAVLSAVISTWVFKPELLLLGVAYYVVAFFFIFFSIDIFAYISK